MYQVIFSANTGQVFTVTTVYEDLFSVVFYLGESPHIKHFTVWCLDGTPFQVEAEYFGWAEFKKWLVVK